MENKRENIFKQLWHSDRLLLSTAYVFCAFFICVTSFRIFYIQSKIFAAVSMLIANAAAVFALFYLFIKKSGGTNKAAEKLRQGKVIYCAMGLAFFISLFIFGVYTLSPFGNYTVLKMDLYHQYGPLFAELYDRVAQGKSLLYSWNSAGGSGFLGNFFNYLSSPFTLLIFWFSKTEVVTTGISVIVFAKCIFSAGTFAFYLKKHNKNNDFSAAAFALLYAFSAYFIAYYWNVMWLDAMLIFPIVILGIERIIDKSNSKIYFLSLIFTFLTNYYMAYMICIFSVIYFIIYYLSHYKLGELYVPKTYDMPKFSKLRQSRLLCSGFRFAAVSVLAAACCAAVLLPIYKTLSSSSARSDSFPTEFKLYFDIYDFIVAHLAAIEPTIRSSGGSVTPNIYCGILSILLFPLFLMSKKISWKEKLMNLLLLAFLFVCCNINYTNFIWHGFHFPNDLPYRFSFMYSFIVLTCAYRVFRHIKEFDYKTLVLTGGIFALICVLAQKFELRYIGGTAVYCSLAFIVVYTFLMCAIISKKLSRVMLPLVLCCAVVSEIFICDVPRFGFGVQESDYVSDYEQYQKALNNIKEKDDSEFYRTELNDIPTVLRMSPCWYNYEGINCFSSMANEDISMLHYRLGCFSNKINSFTYFTQTPVYNMMFDIKYIIDNNDPMKLNDDFYTYLSGSKERLTTYENKYSSSLGFCVNRTVLKNWNVKNEINRFTNQSDFMSLAAGTQKDIFIPVKLYTNGADNCSITSFENDGDGSMSFSVFNSEQQASFNTNFTADENANYYIFFGGLNAFEKAEIETESYNKIQDLDSTPYILDLGALKEGEDVDIKIHIAEDTPSGSGYLWLCRIDEDAFKEAYNVLADDGMLKIDEKTDTYIKGEVTAKQGEILYTSIPFDYGWRCFVDGIQVKPYALADSLLCLETGEGTHQVEFKYIPSGLRTGAVISGVSIGAVLLFFIFKKVLIIIIARLTDNMLSNQ